MTHPHTEALRRLIDAAKKVYINVQTEDRLDRYTKLRTAITAAEAALAQPTLPEEPRLRGIPAGNSNGGSGLL